jgi:hypothetical protein
MKIFPQISFLESTEIGIILKVEEMMSNHWKSDKFIVKIKKVKKIKKIKKIAVRKSCYTTHAL